MGSNKDGTITAEVDGRLDDLFGDEDGQDEKFVNKSTETEQRAGDLVGEKIAQGSHSESENIIHAEDPLIKDLKSVILSLEWEITDQVMQKLGEEIENLKEACKEDKIVVAFLQLLDSLGKYVQKKQAEAHPDSISLLNSVYDNLETVLGSPGLSEAAKKKMLVTEVNKYKELKKHIASGKAASRKTEQEKIRRKTASHESDERSDESPVTSAVAFSSFPSAEPDVVAVESDDSIALSDITSDQNVAYLLKEIHNTIRSEFRALREELKLWRESQ